MIDLLTVLLRETRLEVEFNMVSQSLTLRFRFVSLFYGDLSIFDVFLHPNKITKPQVLVFGILFIQIKRKILNIVEISLRFTIVPHSVLILHPKIFCVKPEIWKKVKNFK